MSRDHDTVKYIPSSMNTETERKMREKPGITGK